MRPYLVLAVVGLAAVGAFGQERSVRPHGPIHRHRYGWYGYGYGYGYGSGVPILTTPEITFQQFSPNPVGASNATTGLSAGATNATITDIPVTTDSVYTEEVWVRGGGFPLITDEVNLEPELAQREIFPRGMRPEPPRQEPGPRKTPEAHAAAWTFYSGPGEEYSGTPAEAATPGKGNVQKGHVYTNDDVNRENEKNGTVKFKGKTEKI